MKNKFSTALSLAVIAAMLITSLALADNVQNDVNSTGNDTITSGGTTTINYSIAANNGDGQTGCNAADSSPATVTINTPAGVTVDTNGSPGNQVTLTFSSCGTNQSAVFSSNTPGDYEITASVSDSGTGTYNTNPAKFTLHVLTPTPPADATAPTAAPTLSGTAGNNGWYTSDVTVTWNWSDNAGGSGIDTGSCPATSTSSGEGALTVSAECYDNAGNIGTASVNVNVDKTAPGIDFAGPLTSAWYNADVTASWNCSDATSGPVSASVSALASGEGNAVPATGTCVDLAGLSTSDTQNFKIDKTAPTVSVTGVSNGATYTLGSVPAAGCSTTDGLSGVAAFASLSSSGGPVGSVTATCSGALDYAGNSGSASVTYSVIYAWNGFFQPVDNLPALNKVKAGSAIPVKFSLNGNQGLSIFAAGYPSSFNVACGDTANADLIETTVTAGSSSLSYDALANQYVYVWKTDKNWGGTCRTLTVKLNDGTIHQANFNFTR
jgi:hypothetical protein